MADLTNPHDRFFKETFSHTEVAADFLAQYLPPTVAALLDPDPGSLELIKGSFIDPDLRQHYSDLLYRVRLNGGGSAFVHVMFEHKSYPDALVAFQLLGYKVRLWQRELRRNPRALLTPIIPVVVYHGRDAWGIPLNFGALVNGPEELRAYCPDFAYQLVDLSLYGEAELRGVVRLRAAMLVLRHIFDPALWHRLPEVFALVRQIEDRETALGCLVAILRYLAAASTTVTQAQVKEAMLVSFPVEGEVAMATIAETWVEEGRRQGLQQGMQQGVEQGIRAGLLTGIEAALDLKFGAAGLALLPDISKIEDVDKLRAMHAAIITAQSPDELKPAH